MDTRRKSMANADPITNLYRIQCNGGCNRCSSGWLDREGTHIRITEYLSILDQRFESMAFL